MQGSFRQLARTVGVGLVLSAIGACDPPAPVPAPPPEVDSAVLLELWPVLAPRPPADPTMAGQRFPEFPAAPMLVLYRDGRLIDRVVASRPEARIAAPVFTIRQLLPDGVKAIVNRVVGAGMAGAVDSSGSRAPLVINATGCLAPRPLDTAGGWRIGDGSVGFLTSAFSSEPCTLSPAELARAREVDATLAWLADLDRQLADQFVGPRQLLRTDRIAFGWRRTLPGERYPVYTDQEYDLSWPADLGALGLDTSNPFDGDSYCEIRTGPNGSRLWVALWLGARYVTYNGAGFTVRAQPLLPHQRGCADLAT